MTPSSLLTSSPRTALRSRLRVAGVAGLVLASLAGWSGAAEAQQRHGGGASWHGNGHYRSGYHHGFRGWPAFGVGVGIGLGSGLWLGGAPYAYPYASGVYPYAGGVYYSPAPVGYAVVQPAPVAEAPPPAPDPVIYPRNAQSAGQTEEDRRECNRWATTLPAAMADAAVFQRAVLACMDGRGYTLR